MNYNGLHVLRKCVLSVLSSRYEQFELILVDNASTDQSLSSIKDTLDDSRIKTVRLNRNLGFSVGNNIGASHASGRYLVFLNNDVEVSENWLKPIVDVLENNHKIGVAQPKLMFLDKPYVVQSSGNYVDRLGFTIPRTRIPEDPDHPCGGISANGAALAIQRDLFNRIGRFEPVFFTYYEDTDLSWRVYLSARRVQLVPSSIVYHKEGSALSRVKLASRINQFVQNQLFTVFKNYSLGNGLIGITLLFLFYIAGSIWYVLRKSTDISIAVLKALFQFLKLFPKCWKSHLVVQQQIRKVSDNQIKTNFLKPFSAFLLFEFYRRGMGYTAIDCPGA